MGPADGAPRLDRDAQWTWWRIRWGWTYGQIAEEWERLNPGDLRLQPRSDAFAREWEASYPDELGRLERPADAARLVRKAVTTFAERARVDFRRGPGRRRGQRPPAAQIIRLSGVDAAASGQQMTRWAGSPSGNSEG
jgi:hypothetical protein